jgi:hypothetical protein
MKRIQLFEFEDFQWFPALFRDSLTKLIRVLLQMMGAGEVLTDLILKVRRTYDFDRIIDIGSGAGGAMPDVIRSINSQPKERPVQLLLTDLYPSGRHIGEIEKTGIPGISYHPDPVDALHLDQTPDGLRTMINSFHHMPPKKARKILHKAVETRTPLLIYELTENKIPTLLWWLFLPLSLVIMIVMVIFMTPFVRPLTWQQLVFTYLVPIIPLAYAWDGQASNVRTYAIHDFGELLKGIKEDGYIWKIGPAEKRNGKTLGYFVLGLPENEGKQV